MVSNPPISTNINQVNIKYFEMLHEMRLYVAYYCTFLQVFRATNHFRLFSLLESYDFYVFGMYLKTSSQIKLFRPQDFEIHLMLGLDLIFSFVNHDGLWHGLLLALPALQVASFQESARLKIRLSNMKYNDKSCLYRKVMVNRNIKILLWNSKL